MVLYEVNSVEDEVVKPEEQWHRDMYASIACPVCWDILPEHRNGPIDIDIDESVAPEGPVVGLPHTVAMDIIRADLLSYLKRWMGEFYIGAVTLRGAPLPGMHSLLAGTGVRLPYRGNERSSVSYCRNCGRRCEGMVDPWVARMDVAGRRVLAGIVGRPLLISEEASRFVPGAIRAELKLNPVNVRDELGDADGA